MIIRAPEPDDAPAILAIVRAHGLPREWKWPEGHHGLVACELGRPVAFCILNETVWGLVVEELWEELSRHGYHGLTALSREIEAIAQRLADEKGEEVACGGIVRLSKDRHIAALKRRGYTVEAEVLTKRFLPSGLKNAKGESA